MKLLDEKGLETVWSTCKVKFALAGHTHNYAGSESAGGPANSAIGVVDYGQSDKNIQIGYAVEGITGDQIKYIAGYTDGGGNVSAKIKNVSKDDLKAWLGIREDGGSYTLPVASDTTLGGIKTGYDNNDASKWAVKVDNNSNAYVPIPGLYHNSDNAISSLEVSSPNIYTTYNPASINFNSRQYGSYSCYFPTEDGTLALKSDIPDTSNLCSVNLVGNISKCKKGYINIKESITGSHSANGLTSGAILFFINYNDATITYDGGIRVNTSYVSSGQVGLSKGLNLLFMEDNILVIIKS